MHTVYQVVYFKDYAYNNSVGDIFHPYIIEGKWHIAGAYITLEKMGEM